MQLDGEEQKLIDQHRYEGGLFMTDLQVSETIGWNSQCFSDENKALIEKRKWG